MEGIMKIVKTEDAQPKSILYVEDDKDSQEMLTFVLERAGYTVSTATTMADGVNFARLEHFDLYILDSSLADGDGIELCRQIRAFDAVTPIIFYSSLAYAADIKVGLAAGAQAYLTKPMGIYTMNETIAGLLAEVNIVGKREMQRTSYNQQKITYNVPCIECLA
jgi:DNA-binding response OmpR family regulator